MLVFSVVGPIWLRAPVLATMRAMAGAAGEPTMRISLAPPPKRIPSAVLVSCCLALAVAGAALGAELAEAVRVVGALSGLVVSSMVLVPLWSRCRPPNELAPIRLDRRFLTVPRSIYREGVDRIDLRELLHLGRAPGPKGFLEVVTAWRRYRIPMRAFVDPGQLDVLGEEVLRRLASLEGGAEHLARLESTYTLGDRLARRRPLVTYGLIATIALIYLIERTRMGFEPTLGRQAWVLLGMGGSSAALDFDQPWRFATASLLHISFPHVFLNGLALFAVGSACERLLGAQRLLALFGASGLGAVATSASLTEAHLSTGASGAIFGLLGGLGALHLFGRRDIPPRFHQPLRQWLLIVGIEALLPVLVPGIDGWSHFGGAVVGFALGTAWAVGRDFRLGSGPEPWSRVLASAVVAAHLVGIAFSVRAATLPVSTRATDFTRAFLETSSSHRTDALELAVSVLRDPDASPSLARVVDTWLERVARDRDASPELLLLRSERLEQMGRLEDAVRLRWSALRRQGSHAYAALAGGLAELDVLPLMLAAGKAPTVRIRRMPGAGELELALTPPLERSLSLFSLLRAPTGEVTGMLEWPQRPASDAPLRRAHGGMGAGLAAALDAGHALSPALWADTTGGGATFLPLDAAALEGWRRLAH